MKITILMPVFNEEIFIEEAISSALNFQYPAGVEISLVVVDDFSTDRTYSIVEGLKNRYGASLILKKGGEKGKNNAFNTAFEYVDFGYVCLCGGDDKIVPSVLLARAIAIEEKQKSSGCSVAAYVSACKIRTFSDDARYEGITIPRGKRGSLSGGAIMFDRSLGQAIFPLPPSLPNEDSWISLHLRFREIQVIDVLDVGLFYRIHANNSHKRGESFDKFNESTWRRGCAAIIFYSEQRHLLDAKMERKLTEEIFLESAKSLRASLSILVAPKIGVAGKLRALTYASRVAYYFKQKFYKLLTGF
ncbi:glycosyltransferase involved in cell wall biosynthesis [Variovorax boronicumulans]|uniref:glycosyltransferase family 2 protein n=1 Tax=Variovorax boronicumulans TaxID=436515 RepID=UPI00278148A8|nr:glycosyltransferase [Variovorax boronicumulans]MDP9911807.1 glycosyltransferase involved in cell wall biosynthesis [Variovorax boronicumulans]